MRITSSKHRRTVLQTLSALRHMKEGARSAAHLKTHIASFDMVYQQEVAKIMNAGTTQQNKHLTMTVTLLSPH